MTAQQNFKQEGSAALLGALEELSHYVGNTPLYPITRLHNNPRVRIYAKLEWEQFGGSVKARPAFNIIWEAVKSGELTQEKRLLDASSGNTGIAYAVFAAAAGIKLTLCIPENASKERKHLLKALGAEVIYTSPFEGTDGAQAVAKELHKSNPELYYYADQYNNEANWKAHFQGTAKEIWEQTNGSVSHFIAGLGTTGTFTGTGRGLRELNKDIQLVALQPESPLHALEGWKHLETAVVPGIFDNQLADKHHEAFKTLRKAALLEGLTLSPSAAANLTGALALANELDEGVIVTVLADDHSKYTDIIQEYNAER
ncbi:MAG: cysteine synthase family protein [Flavobacteriales bacterium]|nr:cysteine synthase family protein [Flavobacteriales bacterium]